MTEAKRSRFRRFVEALGIIVFGLLLVGIVAFGTFYYRESTAMKTVCKPYADGIIAKFIAANWDVAVITANTSAAKQDTTELTNGFRLQLKPLGTLLHYDGGKGNVALGVDGLQISERIFYDAHTTFQHGDADIRLKLKRTQTACEVTEINVEPSIK